MLDRSKGTLTKKNITDPTPYSIVIALLFATIYFHGRKSNTQPSSTSSSIPRAWNA